MKYDEPRLWEHWQKYITDHGYASNEIKVIAQFKVLLEIIKKAHSGSVVIDVGAGENVLGPLFEDAHYIALDASVGSYDYTSLDIVGDVLKLPIADSSVDVALFVWVLEHVREPYIALKEINRILKPGGTLYLLAPHFLHEHMQPYDYFRYTRYGLEYLFQKAEFTDISIKQSSGFVTSHSDIVLYSIYNLLRFVDDKNTSIEFAPEVKVGLEECLRFTSKIYQMGLGIDKQYMDNNLDFMVSGYPTDFICTANKSGILTAPVKYENKQDVLKNIIACPECHTKLPEICFENKKEHNKCPNCNTAFECKGTIFKFI